MDLKKPFKGSRIEFGIARKIYNDKVITLFAVDVAEGRDGKLRAVLRARRLSVPVNDSDVEVRKTDYGYAVFAPGVKIFVKNKDLAVAIAEAIADGDIFVEIDGPSAAKIDGNPLSQFASGISAALGFVTWANLFAAESSEAEEEEPEEETELKPKKKHRRIRIVE